MGKGSYAYLQKQSTSLKEKEVKKQSVQHKAGASPDINPLNVQTITP